MWIKHYQVIQETLLDQDSCSPNAISGQLAWTNLPCLALMHGSEVGRKVARGDLAVSFVKTRCKVSKIVLKEKKKDWSRESQEN